MNVEVWEPSTALRTGCRTLLNNVVNVQECDPSTMLRINCHGMFNQGENLEPSVATDDDRSITAGYIKCGTQKAKGKRQSAKRITQGIPDGAHLKVQ